jgi:hypothetical protein
MVDRLAQAAKMLAAVQIHANEYPANQQGLPAHYTDVAVEIEEIIALLEAERNELTGHHSDSDSDTERGGKRKKRNTRKNRRKIKRSRRVPPS